MNVLFIDDDADMREMVELALSFEDIHTTTASDTASARTLVESEAHFDAIVCDYYLGEVRSSDLLVAIRQARKNTPLVVVTGDLSLKLSSVEADELFVKPVEMEALAGHLKGLVSQRRAAQPTG